MPITGTGDVLDELFEWTSAACPITSAPSRSPRTRSREPSSTRPSRAFIDAIAATTGTSAAQVRRRSAGSRWTATRWRALGGWERRA